MLSISSKLDGFFSSIAHKTRGSSSQDSKIPPHLTKLEPVTVDALWTKIEGLGTHITKIELERAILFAKGQKKLKGTTRFKSRKHKLPFAVTVTDNGTLYLSVGKKHKEEEGRLGMGSFKVVHKALKIEGEFVEVVAELTVKKDLPAALNEYNLMKELESPYIMEAGVVPLPYAAKNEDKLAMFQPLMSYDGSVLKTDKLTFKEKLKVIEDIANGLVLIHAKGVVHQDLRRVNILISGRGESIQGKVSDFGLAEPIDPEDSLCRKAGDVADVGYLLRDAFGRERESPEGVGKLFLQATAREYQERPSAEELAAKLAEIRSTMD